MEDEQEVKAFAASNEGGAQNEEAPKKKKKSVGFNLEQNQVKEFDKTSKITEVVNEEPEEVRSGKKTV